MSETEDRILITPATTPGSFRDENFFLVPYIHTKTRIKKLPWYKRYPPPTALLTASFLQVIIFIISSPKLERIFTFAPNNKSEIWRFLTYMLLHNSWFHLSLNVVIQCLFAANLEKQQGHLRVGLLYLGGGALGAFGASCVRPDLVIGASAGVYALLISHISHVILNFKTIKYKIYRCLSVSIIVISDVCYNLGHFYYMGHPIISWGAHAIGAVAGFALGLVMYKNVEEAKKTRFGSFFWLGMTLTTTLVTFLTIISLQIKRCTPEEYLGLRYVYIC